MNEIHSATLDRLEARIDHQAARIDELFRLLKAHGLVEEDAEDVPLARETRAGRLHVGDATGV